MDDWRVRVVAVFFTAIAVWGWLSAWRQQKCETYRYRNERIHFASPQPCSCWNVGDQQQKNLEHPTPQCDWPHMDIQQLTLIVLALTLLAILWQATSATSAAKTAREALLKLERAFLSVKGFNQYSRWDDGPGGQPINVRYFVAPTLTNTGTTPTRNATLVVWSEYRATPLPAGFDFAYPVPAGPIFIGPDGLMQGIGGSVDATQLGAIQLGLGHFYMWGTATYCDIFDGTPIHTLKFCYRISAVLGTPSNPRTPQNPNGTDVGYTMFMHTEHNSSD